MRAESNRPQRSSDTFQRVSGQRSLNRPHSPRPLPPAKMYREYNEVLPGSADRILRMAEKEREHRIGWEDEALHQASQQGDLGVWSGFVIAGFARFTCGLLAMSGHDLVAGIIGCTGLAGAVAGLAMGVADSGDCLGDCREGQMKRFRHRHR